MTNFKRTFLALAAVPALAAVAYAVNYIPLKPDSANDAPATVFGSPTPGISVGKTTAPNSALDVNGTVTATAFSGALSGASLTAGSVDSTKLASNSVTTAKIASSAVDSTKIASGAVDTSKLASGAADTGKLLCGKGDKSIGYCTDTPAGTPPTCNCQ